MGARQNSLDDLHDADSQKKRIGPKAVSTSKVTQPHWYSVPEPVRRVFEQYPLVTYRENSLPQRARQRRDKNTLHVFSNPLSSNTDQLSCNPTCLKWQAYLTFNEIEFSVVASNNHASPSGSLPFLIPASSLDDRPSTPLTSAKIPRWTSQQIMQEEEVLDMRHEAYMSLIDQNIRNAWLCHLYMDRSNFDSVACPLYVSTTSSNRFVKMAIAYQLRAAAKHELLKSRLVIDDQEIYEAADKAFRSLSTLLGEKMYFSTEQQPGLFDASVFAYTHLLLDECLPWTTTLLPQILLKYPRLVQHRNRLLDICLAS